MSCADFLIETISVPLILQTLLEIGIRFDFLNKRYGLKLWWEIQINFKLLSVSLYSNTFYSKLFM